MPAQAVVVIVAVFLGLIQFQLICIDTVSSLAPVSKWDWTVVVSRPLLNSVWQQKCGFAVSVVPLSELLYGFFLGYVYVRGVISRPHSLWSSLSASLPPTIMFHFPNQYLFQIWLLSADTSQELIIACVLVFGKVKLQPFYILFFCTLVHAPDLTEVWVLSQHKYLDNTKIASRKETRGLYFWLWSVNTYIFLLI